MPRPPDHPGHSQGRRYEKRVIRPDMTVRQVATDYPVCREVFESHGEVARQGTAFGHFEPLTDFAQRRAICLDSLLHTLSEKAGMPVDRDGQSADQIHRGFMVSALVITLTLGAGWGSWLLVKIGQSNDFSAAPVSHIVAHGEAQLWGFIGLFIVGVSLRTVLRDAVRTRVQQRACHVLLTVTLLSLAGGFIWSLTPMRLRGLGLISGATLLAMCILLWGVQLQLLRRKWPVTWARAVMASGFWLTAWAALTCWLRWKVGSDGPAAYSMLERRLLIEFAIFGFAMNSIYGFGQMLLSGFLGTGRPRFWAIESAFWLHNMGVVTLALAGMKILPEQAILFGAVSIAAGTFSFAFGQHAFISKRRTTRSPEKGHWLLDAYIPLAFFWLVTSVFLLVGVHVYEALSGNLAPHAIIGAIRHALTVGFMTTLILGVGQRLIPVFEHSAPTTPELVAPILLLIAIGNALRFVAEIATLYIPVAFVIMPLSALMEWTALLLFTVVISVQIRHRDSLSRSGRVSTSSSLAVLLAYAPWIEEVLIRDGLHYLARARSIPQELTIGAFARSEHRDAGALVDHLNDLLASHVVDDAVNNELRHQVS